MINLQHINGVDLNTDCAALDELILNGAAVSEGDAGAAGAGGDEGGASDIEIVMAGDEGADLPSDLAVDLDGDEDVAVVLVLAQPLEVEGSNRDIGSEHEWGPHVNLLVSLVRGRDGGSEGHLLALVGDVGVEAVVVDSDVVVRVAGGEGDLEV